jgi:hypothetical protein
MTRRSRRLWQAGIVPRRSSCHLSPCVVATAVTASQPRPIVGETRASLHRPQPCPDSTPRARLSAARAQYERCTQEVKRGLSTKPTKPLLIAKRETRDPIRTYRRPIGPSDRRLSASARRRARTIKAIVWRCAGGRCWITPRGVRLPRLLLRIRLVAFALIERRGTAVVGEVLLYAGTTTASLQRRSYGRWARTWKTEVKPFSKPRRAART